MKAAPEPFLRAVAPYREGLVVAVECIFTWYWLADLCAREGIPFVLGHALYMKAIHGANPDYSYNLRMPDEYWTLQFSGCPRVFCSEPANQLFY
jgi:hypothetical protein